MQHYKILVVEDDPTQRELLNEVLSNSEESFEVILSTNGAHAIDILRHEAVDAVLLDKRMPFLDGDTVCRLVRTELQLTLLPIIMVTGTNSPEELACSFAAGATDFIRKPYSPIELIARLKSAVNNKRYTDRLDRSETLLFSLARMVEAKDETTGNHCSRLAYMSMEFGQVLGLSDNELESLRRGGIVHDIGKLGIPDSILLKKGPLNEEEWALMRTHTIIGGHICEGLSSMRDVVPIILYHHERWDGSGYPYGLSGESIPLLARVFQIVDIYDALSSARPYKRALSKDHIIGIFEQETAIGWRDPALMEVFLEILRTDNERLTTPHSTRTSIDEQVFEAIASTGVIDWDRKELN